MGGTVVRFASRPRRVLTKKQLASELGARRAGSNSACAKVCRCSHGACPASTRASTSTPCVSGWSSERRARRDGRGARCASGARGGEARGGARTRGVGWRFAGAGTSTRSRSTTQGARTAALDRDVRHRHRGGGCRACGDAGDRSVRPSTDHSATGPWSGFATTPAQRCQRSARTATRSRASTPTPATCCSHASTGRRHDAWLRNGRRARRAWRARCSPTRTVTA